MYWADVLFSPKGTLKPQLFALIVIGIYVLNLLAGSIIEGQFIKRVGPWPYLGLQAMLTWIWFVAHKKRLADAGRGWVVAAVFAFIYIAAITLMLNAVSVSAADVTEPADPKEPKASLIGTIFAVLFIHTLFTGDPYLIIGLIVLFIGLPLLWSAIVLIYSIVTAARASVTPEPAVASAQPVVLAPPAPESKPRSPFS